MSGYSTLFAPSLGASADWAHTMPAPILRWVFVRQRFQTLLSNLSLTVTQVDDGETKYEGVVDCLNRGYWGVSSEAAHRILVGSWGKATQVRPPRDIDVLFVLPRATYQRFQQRTGNRQSQLLQEIRDVLRQTYSTTEIRGDGQVVVIPFNTYTVEVAPVFIREGGGCLISDTNDGGRYKYIDPAAEIVALQTADRRFNGNVRKLTRILKQWQRYCNVPIKSFHIEAVIMEMLATRAYGGSDEFWFDWLVRDFFKHLISRANGWFFMPVTNEVIYLGDEWLSRVQSAYARALKACDHEYNNDGILAGQEWQKIFGTEIPLIP